MKVAHLIDSGGLYGAEKMLLTLVQEQKRSGIDLTVISLGKPGEGEKPLETELKLIGCNVNQLRVPAKLSISSSMKIIRLCKEAGISVIHSHGYKGNILMGIIPSWIRRIPVVTTLHGYTQHKFFSKMTIYQAVDKVLIRLLDAVVLVSPTIAVSRLGLKQKLRVIPNGIAKLCSSDNVNTRQGDEIVIGSIGRLSKEKNFHFLIQAMPDILKLYPGAKLVIHGEGDLRDELEGLVYSLGLSKNVFLPGYINDINTFLNNIDVYVNCSLTEGMPITLLEAMRVKCLVLASRIPANLFLLESRFSDLLFDLNRSALIGAFQNLKKMLMSEKLYKKEKLQDMFLELYTAEKMTARYQALYLELLRND